MCTPGVLVGCMGPGLVESGVLVFLVMHELENSLELVHLCIFHCGCSLSQVRHSVLCANAQENTLCVGLCSACFSPALLRYVLHAFLSPHAEVSRIPFITCPSVRRHWCWPLLMLLSFAPFSPFPAV